MGFSDDKSSDELMRAQAELCAHVFGHIGSMSLKCAVELGIPDAIHGHGKPMPLSELLPALHISPARAPYVRRLMRMLTHSGIFARIGSNVGGADDDEEDILYTLTPLSILLVKHRDTNLCGFVIQSLHPVMMDPFQSMAAWLKGDEATAFIAHSGHLSLWDVAARDPGFNAVFNQGMESDSKLMVDVLLKDCGHVFEGIGSLVDVGGGTGTAAIAISRAFPGITCTVLDLPHVVNSTERINGAVEFAAGDMFEHIPPADAVLLKSILHDWNHEECVRILKRCKEAVSGGKDGRGKVIIIDQVTGYGGDRPQSATSQLYFDMLMMVVVGGAERVEGEWKKIFDGAGFTRYKECPTLAEARCSLLVHQPAGYSTISEAWILSSFVIILNQLLAIQ